MGDLQNGMLVQHTSLGLGKVVALEPKAVHVFFASSAARFATKLRLPLALPLLTPAPATGSWLSGLSAFALDARTGRYGLAATWLSHADAVARFLLAYPGGFTDPRTVGQGAVQRDRASRWRQAHQLWVELLGAGQGEGLLAAGDVSGLIERALRAVRPVRPLLGGGEKTALEDALRDVEAARGHFAALFDLLAAPEPDQAGFEALAAAVAVSPSAAEEAGWPVVTLLPFVARPDLHLLLRPRFAAEVAHRLGLELAYQPRPTWSTYAAWLRSTTALLEKLRPLGARDLVDVDSFLHVVTAKQPRAPRPVLAT